MRVVVVAVVALAAAAAVGVALTPAPRRAGVRVHRIERPRAVRRERPPARPRALVPWRELRRGHNGYEVRQEAGIRVFDRDAGEFYALVARRPGGRIARLALAPRRTPAFDVGTDRGGRLVVIYLRCRPAAFCRVWMYDLLTRRQRRLPVRVGRLWRGPGAVSIHRGVVTYARQARRRGLGRVSQVWAAADDGAGPPHLVDERPGVVVSIETGDRGTTFTLLRGDVSAIYLARPGGRAHRVAIAGCGALEGCQELASPTFAGGVLLWGSSHEDSGHYDGWIQRYDLRTGRDRHSLHLRNTYILSLAADAGRPLVVVYIPDNPAGGPPDVDPARQRLATLRLSGASTP